MFSNKPLTEPVLTTSFRAHDITGPQWVHVVEQAFPKQWICLTLHAIAAVSFQSFLRMINSKVFYITEGNKSDVMDIWMENKKWNWRSRLIKPKFNKKILTVRRCSCGPNVEFITWKGGGQAQNGDNFYFKLSLTLQVKSINPENNMNLN